MLLKILRNLKEKHSNELWLRRIINKNGSDIPKENDQLFYFELAE